MQETSFHTTEAEMITDNKPNNGDVDHLSLDDKDAHVEYFCPVSDDLDLADVKHAQQAAFLCNEARDIEIQPAAIS